jgi:uncharacterized protein YbaR (Trm112 family)
MACQAGPSRERSSGLRGSRLSPHGASSNHGSSLPHDSLPHDSIWTEPIVTEEQLIDPELLAILACPETHQPLAIADAKLLAAVNARITAGECDNVGGTKVEAALEGGLVREDGTIVYPIRDEIPVLLVDEGISIPAPA